MSEAAGVEQQRIKELEELVAKVHHQPTFLSSFFWKETNCYFLLKLQSVNIEKDTQLKLLSQQLKKKEDKVKKKKTHFLEKR